MMNSSVAIADGDEIPYAGVVVTGESPAAKVTVYRWKGDPLIWRPGDRWLVEEAITNATVTRDKKGNFRIVGTSGRRKMHPEMFPDPQIDLVVVPGPNCEGCGG